MSSVRAGVLDCRINGHSFTRVLQVTHNIVERFTYAELVCGHCGAVQRQRSTESDRVYWLERIYPTDVSV